ncbi:hypothetical protein [Microbacterium sp. SLBN-146]|uniref:hypothetical protein n=1 Tax=Microbacterium sp. SLBN-146 TaxID=2768457 RepID=UPI001153C9C6|nr:hypothetical protein [Microbacterium sp. SLBN-146]
MDNAVEIPVLMHWTWSPLGLLLVIPLPSLIGSLLIPGRDFRSMWGQPSLLSGDFALALLVLVLVIGLLFAAAGPLYLGRTTIRMTQRQVTWLSHSVVVIATVTFAAYAVWLGLGVIRGLSPSVLIGALNGEFGVMSTIKNRFLAPVSGVTTWMHLGVLLGPLLILRKRATGKSIAAPLLVLFALAAFRAFFVSERLALVELGAATLVAFLMVRERPPWLLARLPRAIASFALAWGVLVVFFAALEYNRSWLNYYAEQDNDGLLAFAWNRLLGYYATAVNNGVLYGQASPPDYNFASLVPGVSEIPLVAGSSRFRQYELLLESTSNPEFNNISGLTVPLAALGVWGGAAFFGVLAILIVTLARGVRRGSVLSFLTYSVIAIGILELSRIYYYSSSRFLVIALGLVALWLTYPRRRLPTRSVALSPPNLADSTRLSRTLEGA